MKKYFSHYTFIYPNTHLANHIVELDDNDRIISYCPYEKQLSETSFVSGLLILLPQGIEFAEVKDELLRNKVYAGLIERSSFLVRSFSI